MTKGLLIARAYTLLHGETPKVCLSCVMDLDYAETTFGGRGHSLFARDALEAKVVVGKGLYSSLMHRARWISDYYPVAYAKATSSPASADKDCPSAAAVLINWALYLLLGWYILLKSSLLNRRLKRSKRAGDVFSARCWRDHLIYESRRYRDLKREYQLSEPSSRNPPITS